MNDKNMGSRIDSRVAHAEGMQQNAERLLAEAERKIARQAAVIRQQNASLEEAKAVQGLAYAEGFISAARFAADGIALPANPNNPYAPASQMEIEK